MQEHFHSRKERKGSLSYSQKGPGLDYLPTTSFFMAHNTDKYGNIEKLFVLYFFAFDNTSSTAIRCDCVIDGKGYLHR